MFYKCEECGNIFEEGEQAYVGDGINEPKTAVCPVCNGDIDEAFQCEMCGGKFFGYEMWKGVCDHCEKELIEEYSHDHITELYLMASDDMEGVELNPFIASMFSPSQINEILLNVLIEDNKIMTVDCRNFIEDDKLWFVEKVRKEEQK